MTDNNDDQRGPEARQGFVNATLAALQLDPCTYAEEQAEAFLAGTLPATTGQLMTAHLATCASCAALLSVLARLQQQLPALVHRPAPAGFAQRVLAATSGKVHTAGPGRQLPGLLHRLLQRPRFAAEAAYCGALVCSLALGLPTLDNTLLLQSRQWLRGLGSNSTAMLTHSGVLLEQGSVLGKRRLQSAQAQLQTLYEQGSARVEATLDKIKPAYPELFR